MHPILLHLLTAGIWHIPVLQLCNIAGPLWAAEQTFFLTVC